MCVLAMRDDEVRQAAELYRTGFLSLKAAAWALYCWRGQRDRELTPAEVMERFGASRTAAYRAVADLRLAIAGLGGTHQPVPQVGTGTDQPVPESRIAGIPHIGTIRPANRDGSPYIDSGTQGETHTGETHQPVPQVGTAGDSGWERAAAILSESPQAYPLGDYLARNAHLDEVRSLAADTAKGKYPAGWRLESAALIFVSPKTPDDVRSCRNCKASLNYFLAIARGQTKPYVPPSLSIADEPRPTGTDPRPRRGGPDVMNLDFSRYE